LDLSINDQRKSTHAPRHYHTRKPLAGERCPSLLDALRQDGPEADFEFAPARINDPVRPVDLS
jgi:hypothetical protein